MPRRLPILVFAVTAAIGLILPIATYQSGAQANYLRFERLADEAIDRIASRLNQHISLLIATRSLFEAQSGNVSYRQFSSFVEHLSLPQLYDGIQGIGYADVLVPGEEEWARQRIKRNYGIDRAPFPDSDQDMRTAITMLEPVNERNMAALGFDMYSDETRRLAMQTAMLSGEPKASGVVELVQEINGDKQPGFLVFLALRAKSEGPVDGSRISEGNVQGFIYAPFRVGDLIDAALSSAKWLPVHIEVHDGDSDEGRLLYVTESGPARLDDSNAVRRSLDIAGRRWSVIVTPSDAFKGGMETGIALVLGAVSLLMAAALAVSMRAQMKALDASREVLRLNEAAAAQKDFLLQEMKHRIKNSIARVLAIARQTANRAENLDDFIKSYTARLQAMATSQDILTRSHSNTADLEELCQGELQQVFGKDFKGTTCKGPTQQLGVRSTQALALVFHEMATNALKYGNLHEEDSRLEIDWGLAKDGKTLWLDWREHSTNPFVEEEQPNGDASALGGFGSKLMRSLVEGELSGTLTREMTPSGLHVRIEVPNPID